MKMASLLTMFVALIVAPIAGAYSYRYADNSVDPDLVPRVHNVTNEEREEQELRKLLIERLRQENQSYSHNERIQSQKAKDHFSKQAIVEKIKEKPWWGWVIVGCASLAILGKFVGD